MHVYMACVFCVFGLCFCVSACVFCGGMYECPGASASCIHWTRRVSWSTACVFLQSAVLCPVEWSLVRWFGGSSCAPRPEAKFCHSAAVVMKRAHCGRTTALMNTIPSPFACVLGSERAKRKETRDRDRAGFSIPWFMQKILQQTARTKGRTNAHV